MGVFHRREADAVLGKAERDRLAAGELAVGVILDDRLDRDIGALDHAGQHGARRDAVLVGVDADGEMPRLFGRLDDAEAGAAGHLVDDIGAGVEHRLRHLQADRRIAEIVGIGDLDLDVRVDVARALDVADDEFVDADRLGAADHADDRLAVHALDRRIRRDQRRERAGEIGALLLLEQNRGDIGARLHLVEDHVVRVARSPSRPSAARRRANIRDRR